MPWWRIVRAMASSRDVEPRGCGRSDDMWRSKLSLAILAVVLASAVAHAEEVKKKLYRWVDKDGKVHFDDALPPEAVNQARQEFSSKTGTQTGAVDRALTPEELAQKEAADKAAAAATVS